jgi:hypothetical protein
MFSRTQFRVNLSCHLSPSKSIRHFNPANHSIKILGQRLHLEPHKTIRIIEKESIQIAIRAKDNGVTRINTTITTSSPRINLRQQTHFMELSSNSANHNLFPNNNLCWLRMPSLSLQQFKSSLQIFNLTQTVKHLYQDSTKPKTEKASQSNFMKYFEFSTKESWVSTYSSLVGVLSNKQNGNESLLI